MGHALGIVGHPGSPQSLMSPYVGEFREPQLVLQRSDLSQVPAAPDGVIRFSEFCASQNESTLARAGEFNNRTSMEESATSARSSFDMQLRGRVHDCPDAGITSAEDPKKPVGNAGVFSESFFKAFPSTTGFATPPTRGSSPAMACVRQIPKRIFQR